MTKTPATDRRFLNYMIMFSANHAEDPDRIDREAVRLWRGLGLEGIPPKVRFIPRREVGAA